MWSESVKDVYRLGSSTVRMWPQDTAKASRLYGRCAVPLGLQSSTLVPKVYEQYLLGALKPVKCTWLLWIPSSAGLLTRFGAPG